MMEIEKTGESTDSNAYIKDDKGFIHKFKLNMKTWVDHDQRLRIQMKMKQPNHKKILFLN